MIDKIKADLICRLHYESVHKFCLNRLSCNTDDADDITQEVFLFFQQKADVLEDIHIKAWLFSVANLKTKEYFRKKNKEINFVSIDEIDIDDETATLCAMFEQLEDFDIEKIDKYRDIIFNHLTEREKLLYQKRFVEGKTLSQIAEEMNTDAKYVSVMLSRMKKKLEILELMAVCSLGQLIIKLFF